MEQDAHLTCAFPDAALPTADKLSEVARAYGLAAWTTAATNGEWQIRIEGDHSLLHRFTHEVGLMELFRSAL